MWKEAVRRVHRSRTRGDGGGEGGREGEGVPNGGGDRGSPSRKLKVEMATRTKEKTSMKKRTRKKIRSRRRWVSTVNRTNHLIRPSAVSVVN